MNADIEAIVLRLWQLCTDEYDDEWSWPYRAQKAILRELEGQSRETLAAVVLRLVQLVTNRSGERAGSPPYSCVPGTLPGCTSALTMAAADLMRKTLPFTPAELRFIIGLCHDEGFNPHFRMLVWPVLLVQISRRWGDVGDDLRPTLTVLYEQLYPDDQERVAKLLFGDDRSPFVAGDVWADHAADELAELTKDRRRAWNALLLHCRDAKGARPGMKWSKNAESLLEAVGADEFEERAVSWLPLISKDRPDAGMDRYHAPHQLYTPNADTARAICWLLSSRDRPEVVRALGELALGSYKKVPGWGSRNLKVGNAAVYALGTMPGRGAIPALAMLCIKVKSGQATAPITKALDEVSKREGLPRDEIDEMSVPAYGLDEVGRGVVEFGASRAFLRVNGSSGASAASLSWQNAKGKNLKSVPAEVKKDHGEALREVRGTLKDVQKMLPAQRDRIDSLFVHQRTWAWPTWRERYLDHPLVGTIARRLVWIVETGRDRVACAWRPDDEAGPPFGAGRLVDAAGEGVEIDEESAIVSLWHPIEADAEPGSVSVRPDVFDWRTFYESGRTRQPFKQAHREVYLLTDDERETGVYSNRFASHVLRQHQCAALARQRGWVAQLQGFADSVSVATHKNYPAWGLRAEYWYVGDDLEPDSAGFAYPLVIGDQLRFYPIDSEPNTIHGFSGLEREWGTGRLSGEPLPLERVPPLILSETMRDVDLMVGVSSIGNDPRWRDGGPNGEHADYWDEYRSGAARSQNDDQHRVLARILDRLDIAPRCSLDENSLVVRGVLNTYHISLRSGIVRMGEGGPVLSIAMKKSSPAAKKAATIHLPFEDDDALSGLLSKAILLAADDAITDPDIVSQIVPGD